MRARTRYVLLGGAGILVLGLVAGSVAYLQGGLTGLVGARVVPDELRYVPADVSFVAYADVREVMRSDFRQRLRGVVSSVVPNPDGQREFFDQTGMTSRRTSTGSSRVSCRVPMNPGVWSSSAGGSTSPAWKGWRSNMAVPLRSIAAHGS